MANSKETYERLFPADRPPPQTEPERRRLQRDMINFASKMFRECGAPKVEARRMAELIHGGKAGRILHEIAFGNPDDRESKA